MLNVHLTLARTRGGPPVPDVFNGCSFIPRAHFETSLVMVSCYGYEIRRQKQQVVKPILGESTCFFNLFQK